jgi:ATP-dependent Clp protease ATP-binding subunit ClpA
VFDADLKHALTHAREAALRLRHERIDPVHHALGVLRQPSRVVVAVLGDVDAGAVARELESQAGRGTASLANYDIPYSDASRDTVGVAVSEARTMGHSAVGADHLLLGVLQVSGLARTLLEAHGLSADAARAVIRARRTGAA